MARPQIDFWYAIGSTYTYLTVMRISHVCERENIEVRWRPFNIRKIMTETDNLPFPDSKPAKKAYMWRDLERRARTYGLPIKMPVSYPLRHFDRANKIAILAQLEGWCPDYTIAAYKLWFQEGFPAGDEANIDRVMEEIGKPVADVLDRIDQDDVTEAYEENTDLARKHGVFGAPSFVAAGELFWGDDRLEDAIKWARSNGCA